MTYVCAIIKDEHEYIREWVLHNRALGFDKIILYDNNSSKPYDKFLEDFIRAGYVKIKAWNTDDPRRQMGAYEDFVQSGVWRDDDWCAFIDPDEYIYFDTDKTIAEFLKRYTHCAAVTLFWKVYGASGRIDKPIGLSIAEAYFKEGCWNNPGFMFKTIARLNRIGRFYDAHRIVPKEGGSVVTTSGKPVRGMNKEKDYARAHIKHYITRSWEDFVQKMKRKNITRQRDIDTFLAINPDMEERKTETLRRMPPN